MSLKKIVGRKKEVESSGFIQTFLPYGRKKRDHFYRVIDEFSLFHLRWIEPLLVSFVGINEKGYWENMVKTPAVSNWAGHAFEDICLKHLYQIRLALGLNKIACKTGTWSHTSKKGSSEDGVQIDLLFDREDGAITICEIKYSDKPFIIEKGYAKKLIKKMDVFESQLKTTKQLFLAMITTMGIKNTVWAGELVENNVTLQDLFN